MYMAAGGLECHTVVLGTTPNFFLRTEKQFLTCRKAFLNARNFVFRKMTGEHISWHREMGKIRILCTRKCKRFEVPVEWKYDG